MYIFKQITPTASQWETIEGTYDNTVYKTQRWFTFLESLGVKSFVCEVYRDSKLVGYFVGEKVRRVFNLIGAPIEGVGTAHQGLSMLDETSSAERIAIYNELAKWVFRKNLAVWFQVEDYCIKENDMTTSNPTSRGEKRKVHNEIRYENHDRNSIDLTLETNTLFKKMSQKSCRYMISKAKQEGITIREAEDPMAFVDLHFKQHLAIMKSKGLDALKPKSFYRKLVDATWPTELLLLEAVIPDGTVVGTGIYALNHGSACYFSAAYDKTAHVCPNELMNWEAIQRCKTRGAKFFDLNGVDHWKFKYGGSYYRQPRLIYAKFRWLIKMRKEASNLYHKHRYLLAKIGL